MNKYNLIFVMFAFMVLTGCKQDEMILTADDGIDTQCENTDTCEDTRSSEQLIYVYVCGHVNNPGVYTLEESARICDALEMAGGITLDGNGLAIQQAEHVTDGMTLYVPGIDEQVQNALPEAYQDDGLVNINTADKETLMTVPGIGESKAEAIITYRNEHGSFSKVEDLMQISGIKEGVFNKIKDHIKVSG